MVATLGAAKETVGPSEVDVELNWEVASEMVASEKTDAEHILEVKHMLPVFVVFVDAKIAGQFVE
jgi:hypothetical protein